jgi:hypothetical protein
MYFFAYPYRKSGILFTSILTLFYIVRPLALHNVLLIGHKLRMQVATKYTILPPASVNLLTPHNLQYYVQCSIHPLHISSLPLRIIRIYSSSIHLQRTKPKQIANISAPWTIQMFIDNNAISLPPECHGAGV